MSKNIRRKAALFSLLAIFSVSTATYANAATLSSAGNKVKGVVNTSVYAWTGSSSGWAKVSYNMYNNALGKDVKGDSDYSSSGWAQTDTQTWNSNYIFDGSYHEVSGDSKSLSKNKTIG
ncbi:hypothetical protein HYH38_16190 [Clostridium botulinum]|uniref:Uncharacterized protein n=1 Tax=Clostridium botulinum TaxID=1491 RepID=A0A0M1M2K8_CLOBO|nr:hypothetical protein [Clostridium botulinum]ALT05443.1 hypothetical protein [Clostridium botulinum]ALT05541.1 hypothetical protein [Clostridium botulinum]ALT05637.1 hypothetical protein [Clostridium botulinum]ALT05737.1 hypothetical protein [Clostridium botulinum]ALT05839.1 hypothetical protein [Clostridium botulinum]